MLLFKKELNHYIYDLHVSSSILLKPDKIKESFYIAISYLNKS